MGVTYTGFRAVRQSIDSLVKYLKSKGILLPVGSRLALAIDHSQRVVEAWEKGTAFPPFDAHLYVGDLANAWWLSSMIMRVKGSLFESELIPKLALLAKADPLPLTPGQQSGARDAMFEVIVGCVCSAFASDVHFEEPDVTCVYRQTRWNLACKVAYGSSRETAKDIRAGMRQIERSDEGLGIVVVQMTNRFPHDLMYEHGHVQGKVISFQHEVALWGLFDRLLVPLTHQVEVSTAAHLRKYPRKWDPTVRGAVFVASTIGYFRERRAIINGAVFSRWSGLRAMPEDEFVKAFNRCWQKI